MAVAPAAGPTRGLVNFHERYMAEHIWRHLLEDRFLYSPQLGWMEWDGMVWSRCFSDEGGKDSGIAVKREIAEYIQAWIVTEVATLAAGQMAILAGFMKGAGLDRLERALKYVRGVTVSAKVFDADPYLLNTPSGVVDLLDGSVSPSGPGHLMTRITGASYRPGARHQDWDKALLALPDDDTRRWLQGYLGRGLIGRQGGCEFSPFLIGGGQNGKSLIIGAALRAVGGYGGMVNDEVLAKNPHPEDVMRLMGQRLAVIEELADGHKLNTAKHKQITGTDKMVGRHLYRSTCEWEPTHTLVVTTNFHPIVVETDEGTWRRLMAVPFPFHFPLDPGFKERVLTGIQQQEAVLAWLVEGSQMAMPPASAAMEKATARWRVSVDLFAQFLEDMCVEDTTGQVARALLLDRFNDYAISLGHKPLGARAFAERFRDHKIVRDWGVTESKAHGVRGWSGLSLKSNVMGRIGA